ncbi:MAG: hemerythrin family protein [Rhodospirillaceae bacterium]|nr:hemerythrin family protein [Rhodospirillaceae bacterium]MCK5546584.1 hemerythrin family protein [Rhodospirillaceae bacterium]
MKNIISWDYRLAIDGGSIDSDHKKIIEVINRFLSKVGKFESAAEIMDILEELHSQANDHFRREEELQRLIKYPDRDIHFTEHNRLSTKLEKLMEEVRPTGGAYVNIMGHKVADFIHEWLFTHILKSDMKMRSFVKSAATKTPLNSNDDINENDAGDNNTTTNKQPVMEKKIVVG